jgi:predicted dehydrogenase
LGRFHAQKYASLKDIELVGVVDTDPERAQEVAREVGCNGSTEYLDLISQVDLVSIAVPTQFHYKVAKDCLEAGCHLLLEKPITRTVAEAEELILDRPMFIESQRLAPFKARGTDVNVVLDLMIHDLDIILSLVASDIKTVNSVGVPVLSEEVDMASARLQFESGCVANVTASRASRETVRKIRIFQHDAYISIDYQACKIGIYRKNGDGLPVPGLPNVTMQHKSFSQEDSLLAEIRSFVEAVRNGTEPLVGGDDGKRALELAMQINSKLWHEVTG